MELLFLYLLSADNSKKWSGENESNRKRPEFEANKRQN